MHKVYGIRSINSFYVQAPYRSDPKHTIIKHQNILSIALLSCTVNVFSANFAQPVVADGGSDRQIQNRIGEGGAGGLLAEETRRVSS